MMQTDAELAKWLREKLLNYGSDYYDREDVGQVLTALVALLREAGQRLDRLLDERAVLGAARLDDDIFATRLRAVLGEGR